MLTSLAVTGGITVFSGGFVYASPGKEGPLQVLGSGLTVTGGITIQADDKNNKEKNQIWCS